MTSKNNREYLYIDDNKGVMFGEEWVKLQRVFGKIIDLSKYRKVEDTPSNFDLENKRQSYQMAKRSLAICGGKYYENELIRCEKLFLEAKTNLQ